MLFASGSGAPVAIWPNDVSQHVHTLVLVLEEVEESWQDSLNQSPEKHVPALMVQREVSDSSTKSCGGECRRLVSCAGCSKLSAAGQMHLNGTMGMSQKKS